jgi:hypothetical protein
MLILFREEDFSAIGGEGGGRGRGKDLFHTSITLLIILDQASGSMDFQFRSFL